MSSTLWCRNQVSIPLSVERAWSLLADFDRWPSWNPFVVRVRGARQPVVGAQVRLELCWPDGSPGEATDEIVEVVDSGERRHFSWSYRGLPNRLGLLAAERTITLEAVSEHECRYLSEERFEGPLRSFVPLAEVREGCERMAAAFAGVCGAEAEPDLASPPVATESAGSCPFGARSAPRERGLLPEPPLVSGALPGLGHMLEFRTEHRELFERGQREHGNLFAIALGPWKCAVVAGPELGAVFYGRTDHELHTAKVYGYLSKMFGRVALTQTPEAYAAERHILTAPFKARLMEANLAVIDGEVQAWIERLGERGEFELVSSFSALLQQISAHVLMGRDFRDRMDAEFWSAYDDLAQGLDQSLPPWLPLPRFIRRDIAKARLHRKLGPFIERRRAKADGSQHEDMLQVLVDAKLDDGSPLPVERVIDYVLALVFAGFETTTGHAAWGLIHLLQHRAVLTSIREQVDASLAGFDALDRISLAKLEPVRRALRETERFNPVADRHVRSVEQDLDIGGHRVPKGWIMMSAVALTHRMPEHYAQPEIYDPSRFTRGEGKTRYSLVGFGGGRHRCTGVSLAYNEMTILLARLVEAFELELVAPLHPRIADTSGVLVPEPTTIRYRRRR